MRFDNTVTLGNVLTAASMMLAGVGLYANMSERMTRLEEQTLLLKNADVRHEQDLRQVRSDNREVLFEIKGDIKELRLALQKK